VCYTEDVLKGKLLTRGRAGGENMAYGIIGIVVIVVLVLLVMQVL
jgi:hypothetical protein